MNYKNRTSPLFYSKSTEEVIITEHTEKELLDILKLDLPDNKQDIPNNVLNYYKRTLKTGIYLTEKELLDIFNLDLTDCELTLLNQTLKLPKMMLENARDIFLISANTGLRVSDLNKLDKKNILVIDDIQYINITTNKTGAEVTIPINPMVSAILKKRGGTPPKRMPDQLINFLIKKIGELAKINSVETKTFIRGGKKTTLKYFKYDLIYLSTARRSFCTNAYKSGMPTIDIMAISGHHTKNMFYDFIKVNDLERAKKNNTNNLNLS